MTDILCPICGKGTLRTVDFGEQQPESRQVQTFTCGHEVEGEAEPAEEVDLLGLIRTDRKTGDRT